eukprot:TRINITY_DN64961_c0_g1_i1.p1 TRINITY_DN64961_c0_g1~~TRINITY_DN64961_c0_g1_i1.p1  ORF type:complete len:513 (+),score=99.75 TRINITY_DN64961_c0_g1_i1:53-1591(+)
MYRGGVAILFGVLVLQRCQDAACAAVMRKVVHEGNSVKKPLWGGESQVAAKGVDASVGLPRGLNKGKDAQEELTVVHLRSLNDVAAAREAGDGSAGGAWLASVRSELFKTMHLPGASASRIIELLGQVDSGETRTSHRTTADLFRETCPGPAGKEPHLVRFISRLQNPKDCKAARLLIPYGGVYNGGLFGAGNGGLGFGAELGPATCLLSLAVSRGRIYMKNENRTHENFFDTSKLFRPLSNCSAPSMAEVLSAAALNPDLKLDRNDRVMTVLGHWQSPETVDLENTTLPGFSLPPRYFQAAASLYFMRLTDDMRQSVESMLRKSLPPDFDPERAISMPVRAQADKCGGGALADGKKNKGESQCLSFQDLMRLAESIRRYDPEVRDIILTSDSADVIAQARAVPASSGWRFIFNSEDASGREGGGWRPPREAFELPTKKSLLSLHLQMRGKYFVVNGNSHWGDLIALLASNAGGCSFTSDPMVIDLRTQAGNFFVCGVKNQDDGRCQSWIHS